MFKLDDDFTEEDLATVVDTLTKNYILRTNDRFNLDVFTNGGERLIDPNNELNQMLSGGVGGGNNQNQNNFRDRFQYTIQADGFAFLPMVGNVYLDGLTVLEAEMKLASKYDSIYKGTFVKLRMDNQRVFLLGAPGGQVIPLANENTSIVEIIAIGGGINFGAKAQNIKLIRGELVYQIDLSTVSGMKASSMNVAPGDIIYVEPWRQVWLETLRDIAPALSLASSVLTLLVIVQNLSQ